MIDPDEYEANVDAKPRFGGGYKINKVEPLVWKKENSHFKKFVADSETLLSSMLEQDWENIRVQKLVRSEEDRIKLKGLIKGNYSQIKGLYKYYSSLNQNSDIFSIS